MRWQVSLIGPEAVLAELAHALPIGGDPILVSVDGSWTLESRSFEQLADAGAVRTAAEHLITSLSGISRLLLGSGSPLSIANVTEVRADGSRAFHLQAESGSFKITGGLSSVVVTRLGGVVEEHRASGPSPAWLRRAVADSEVTRALRLRDAGDLSWTDLYRIFEIVCAAAGGEKAVCERGWATRSALERFTRSANSVTAAGDQARHGVERTEPPPTPMQLPEAQRLIDHLLRWWIEDRVA